MMKGRPKSTHGFLGPVALGYLLLDFVVDQLPWLPATWATYVRIGVWAILGCAALSRIPAYEGWAQEARHVPLFLLSMLFMVASLAFEAVFGVHFVTALMGLDWHRSQPPLPDTGQWLFQALDERLPAPVTALLRAPLLGLHHFLALFLMLCFSTLWGCTPRPGVHIGAQYMRAMAWGRLLRTLAFVGTILPSPRPWCGPHRFQVPAHASPWAQQYHLPYAHDQMALWGLLKDHRAAAPPSESPPEFVPAWGRLQFLAPFLRPTPESSDDWFTTLKRAGGGCNDLVFSGHMLVAALTAAAFQDVYPGWTSAAVWALLAHSGMREVRERHHYSVDVVLGCFVGVMLWRATSPRQENRLQREDALRKAAKDGDMDRVRDILERKTRIGLEETGTPDGRTKLFGAGLLAGTFALGVAVFLLCNNG